MKSTNFILREGKIEDAHECGLICYQAFKILHDQHNYSIEWASVEATIEWFSSLLKAHYTKDKRFQNLAKYYCCKGCKYSYH